MSGQLWRIRCTIVVKFTEQAEMREDKYWVYFYAELESYQYFALFACRRQHSPLDSVAWGESRYTLLRSRYHHTQQIQVSVWKQLGYEIIIHTFGIRWRMSDQKIKIFINFYLLWRRIMNQFQIMFMLISHPSSKATQIRHNYFTLIAN